MNKIFEFVGLWLYVMLLLAALLTAFTHRGILARWVALAVAGTMIAMWAFFR